MHADYIEEKTGHDTRVSNSPYATGGAPTAQDRILHPYGLKAVDLILKGSVILWCCGGTAGPFHSFAGSHKCC